MPNHRPNPNQVPRRRSPVPVIVAAGAVLVSGAIWVAKESYEPSNKVPYVPDMDNGDTTASAPLTPGPVESDTTAPTPSRTTELPAPAPSTSNPEDNDPMASKRHRIADRYLGCALVSFTKSGNGELTLDLSLQSNTNSIDARAEGKSDELYWGTPNIVLTTIKDSKPVTPAFFNAKITGDLDHPNNPVVYPPSSPKEGTTMGVWIEGNAISVNNGSEKWLTTTERYCGAIDYHKESGWRMPSEAPDVQDVYVNDRLLSSVGS